MNGWGSLGVPGGDFSEPPPARLMSRSWRNRGGFFLGSKPRETRVFCDGGEGGFFLNVTFFFFKGL